MGQADILKALEDARFPLSGREIANIVGLSWQGNVSLTLQKLIKNKEVRCIEINRHEALKHFGSKRKLRLYYIGSFNKRNLSKAH